MGAVAPNGSERAHREDAISPWSGKAAACDKPETWTTFRHACVALRRYTAAGIGFVFTSADPFCGIDLDKCRAKNGRIKDESIKLIHQIGSYAEVSPSGDGLPSSLHCANQ